MTPPLEPEPRPGWLLDELTAAGRENLDPAHVARYDEKEDAEAAAEVALLERLGLGPDSTVVELGPGTGQFTLAAAARCRRLVAVDVSEPMLERLRGKLAAAGAGNVEVVRAGFLSYEHAGPPADFAYSRYALHHLPDFWKALALARLRALLRPGGVLRLWDVVFGFDPAEAEARIEAWCASGGETAEGEWSRAELARAGFEIEAAERSGDGIFARYVARAT